MDEEKKRAPERMVIEASIDGVKRKIAAAVKSQDRLAAEEYRITLERLCVRLNELQPNEQRYIVQDATTEKLGDILSRNPNGIGCTLDELTFLLKSFERKGHESARSFYLKAHNGLNSERVDRIGRGSIFIPSLYLVMIGGIQPGAFAEYVNAAMQNGTGADGMVQRFQLTIIHRLADRKLGIDRAPDSAATAHVTRLFEVIDSMASDALGGFLVDESVNAIHFDPDAQELFNEWLRQHEVELANQDLHNAVESHLSKYAATMPALALVFHVLDYATFVLAGKDDKELRGESSGSVLPDNVPGPWPVSATATHLAAQWIDFLKLHMHALYGTVLNAEVEIAHALLEKMRTGKIRSGMKVRQIYRHGWDKLSTKEAVERGLEVLEDHQWIRLRPEEKAPTGRPASRSFDINPALISKRKSS